MKAFLIRNMPDVLHQALKMQAVEKRLTLQELLIKILSEATDKKRNGKAA
jgi:hypothetical protein